MGLTRRKFTRELKMAAIQQLDAGSSAAEVARAFEINANLLHRWRKEFQHWPRQRLPRSRKATLGGDSRRPTGTQGWAANRGNRFFQGVLAAHRGTADAAGTDWKAATCQHIQAQIQEGIQMTILRMCELGDISRAGLYRFDPEVERCEEELDLRDAIQRIALEFPCYGLPRITAELRRQGWEGNHKRVARINRRRLT